MPNMQVFRPGDGNETSSAYKLAIQNRKRPSTLCLSRQGMANQARTPLSTKWLLAATCSKTARAPLS